MKPSILGYIVIAAWLFAGGVVGGAAGVLGAFLIGAMVTAVQQAELVIALFRRVRLHTGGVDYRQLGSKGTVLFDDVDEVFIDTIPGAGWSGVRLREHGGRLHELSFLWHDPDDCLALGNSVIQHCSMCHLESAKSALGAGERLDFGPVAIGTSAVRLEVSKHVEPVDVRWDAIQHVSAFDDVFTFALRNGRFHVVPIRSVPHPHLLIALLKELAVWHDGPPPPALPHRA